MSTERGNIKKKGPRHQNATKFKHNKNSKKTKKILSSPIEGLCKRCHDKIEWRKQYRKYKPLTAPKKWSGSSISKSIKWQVKIYLKIQFLIFLWFSVKCEQKKVTRAYHIVCEQCAVQLKICAKCSESRDVVKYAKLSINPFSFPLVKTPPKDTMLIGFS
jgi:hypothetical protein